VFPDLAPADEAADAVGDAAADADDAVPISAEASDEIAVVAAGRSSEPELIGVMDSQPDPASIDTWAPLQEPVSESDEQGEPVTAVSGSNQGGNGSLLQTVPSHRPMSWLRRDSNSGDRPPDA
jgi:hypothetical protein